jgi:NifU-like protein involved in Fe-S cluster formation
LFARRYPLLVAEGYSETTLEHYESPRNCGLLEHANARAQSTNPVCGDVLELTLLIEGGRVEAAGFEVQGCVAATAAASAMTELAIGRSLAEARDLDSQQIIDALGGLPTSRAHGAILAAQTLAAAVAGYEPSPSGPDR